MIGNKQLSNRSLLRRIIPVAVVLGLSALFSWRWLGWQMVIAETRHKFPTVQDIQTRGLASWLDDPQRPQPVLLDVREPAEFDVSHLAKARRVQPGSDPSKLNLPKHQPIVTYCSVGYRSADYAQQLQKAGYTDVRNLEGSIFQWANEGRPVFKDGLPADKVHPYNNLWGKLLKPSLRADVPPAAQTR